MYCDQRSQYIRLDSHKTQKSPRPLVNAPNGYLNDGPKYLRLKKLLRLKILVLKLLEYSDAI